MENYKKILLKIINHRIVNNTYYAPIINDFLFYEEFVTVNFSIGDKDDFFNIAYGEINAHIYEESFLK